MCAKAFVILRVSLAARMVYLARACGPVIAWKGPQGERAPLEAHDEQVRRTLSALLQRPWDTEARRLLRGSLILWLRCFFRPRSRVSWAVSGLCA
jgi:hypothetical protein